MQQQQLFQQHQQQLSQQQQQHQTYLPETHQPQSQAQSQPNNLQKQQQVVDNHNQSASSDAAMSQFGSASQSNTSLLQSMTSLCHQQSFSDTNGGNNPSSPLHTLLSNFSPDESSQLLNLTRTNSAMTSSGWPSKRQAVDSSFQHSTAGNNNSNNNQSVMEQLRQSHTSNVPPNTVSLPPFPSGQECEQEENPSDPHSHLVHGSA